MLDHLKMLEHKDTETKIAEGGKNTAGKLFILSVTEINFQEFLLTN